MLLLQNSVTDVSIGFRPPCWCPSGWAPAWRLHTNLYKFGYKVSPHILHKKNCYDLKLGESLCIFTFFLFSESGLYLLNGFNFYFEWRDTENQQYDKFCSVSLIEATCKIEATTHYRNSIFRLRSTISFNFLVKVTIANISVHQS